VEGKNSKRINILRVGEREEYELKFEVRKFYDSINCKVIKLQICVCVAVHVHVCAGA